MGLAINGWLEKKFELEAHGTTVKRELMAGTASFLAIAAMPAITPAILKEAGMDETAVFWATTLSIIFVAVLYALWVNYPFLGGPSVGVSPWVAAYLVNQLGVPWQMVLMCTFISGILFVILSIVGFREKILGAIPMCLKNAFGAGIGAFISTVGLINSGIIRVNSKAAFGLELGDLTNINTLLAVLTVFIIGFFLVRGKQGGFLFGIAVFTIIGLFIVDPATGHKITQAPAGSIISFTNPVKALAPGLFKISFSGAETIFSNPVLGLGIILFTIFFIDVFDTIGTLTGLSSLAGYMDEKGDIPNLTKCFLIDAFGTIFGSLMGVTLVTTYVDSSVGIAEGGRTGLTSLWAAILFVFTLMFAPLFTMVPVGASSAAVIMIGALMFKSILKVNLEDFSDAFPAFLCVFMMPYTGNMGIGILSSIFAYTLLKTFKTVMVGKSKDVEGDILVEEKPGAMMWVLSVVFIIYIITQSIEL